MKDRDVTRREWQLLSAYVDGQASPRQRKKLEKLLKEAPATRQALEELQRTKTLLSWLPKCKAPRNFTLSPDTRMKPAPSFLLNGLRYSAVAAAMLLAAVLIVDFIPSFNPFHPARTLRADEPAMMAAEPLEEKDEEPPAIIFWGGSPPMEGYGKGGSSSWGIGGGGDAGQMSMEEVVLSPAGKEPPAEMSEESLLEEAPTVLESEAAEQELILPPAETMEEESGRKNVIEINPILGVAPAGERGKIQEDRLADLEVVEQPLSYSLRSLEIALGLVVLGTSVSAWLLNKKRHQPE